MYLSNFSFILLQVHEQQLSMLAYSLGGYTNLSHVYNANKRPAALVVCPIL